MELDFETSHFMLSLSEATRLSADRVAVPFSEAAPLLVWVQYRQALNEARDPSFLPAGAQRNLFVSDQAENRRIFSAIIGSVLPYVTASITAEAEQFLQNS